MRATFNASKGESQSGASEQGSRLDHDRRGENRQEPAMHEEPAIAPSKWDPTFDLASQHKDLMPQQCILGDEPTLRPEGRSQNGQQKRNLSNHRPT
jgi:hypothetical protein